MSGEPDDLRELRRIAQRDQGAAGTNETAARMGAYFAALLAAGFERDEAMCLVRDWHDAVLDRVFGRRP